MASLIRLPVLAPRVLRQNLRTSYINSSVFSRNTYRSFHPSLRQSLRTQNPQTDDSGNPLTISITPAASNRLHQIHTREKNPGLALRVLVESGGCHGFQYTMSLTDKIDPEEDTVFEEEDTGAKVVMDLSSLELLNGSKVDYESELIGSQFKIIDNPAAESSCGCGTSFDIKFS